MNNFKLIHGDIIFTKTFGQFELFENGYILLKDNKVKDVFTTIPTEYKSIEMIDYGNNLIIPSFIDLHLHAPQFPNLGLGLDKELMPWLDTYTFPEENKYKDIFYAKKVYSKLIHELWKNGTTRCCVFATIHKDSTELLFELFNSAGLGAYIGKVNMDRNCPEYLKEHYFTSLKETREIVLDYKDKYELVKPIISPRFVPTCTFRLLKSLGDLSIEFNIPVQSHLSENIDEIKFVKTLHPNFLNYSDVYDKASLLGSTKTIMAHCVLLEDDEIKMLANKNVYVAHCPNSNSNLSSGIAPIRKLLNSGVKVGLATDISGGHSLSMLDVMTAASQVSNLNWVYSNKIDNQLKTSEVFYLATKGGGEFFGKVGSFEEDYYFDALIIDDSKLTSIKNLSLEERLQKFIYTGNCNLITERYIAGKIIPEPLLYT